MSVLPGALQVWTIAEVRDRQEFEGAATQLDMVDTESVGLLNCAPPRRSRIECFLGQKVYWPRLPLTVRMTTGDSSADGRDASCIDGTPRYRPYEVLAEHVGTQRVLTTICSQEHLAPRRGDREIHVLI